MAAPTKFKFDVDAYYKMYEAGIIPEKGIELIEGEIFEKHPVATSSDGHTLVNLPPTKLKFTIDDYYRLAELSIIPRRRVELINGEIIKLSPIGSSHTVCVKKINFLLHSLLQNNYIIGVQSPILIHKNAEPEPDVSILKFKEDFYASSHPEPKDVITLIEVADSSYKYDRETKGKLYAKSEIARCILVNLKKREIEVFTLPENGAYRKVEKIKGGTFTLGIEKNKCTLSTCSFSALQR